METNRTLKRRLDMLVKQYHTAAFADHDPVQFPRMFTDRQDIEITAFLCSMIVWGNRKAVLKSCHKLIFEIMEGCPHDYVMSCKWKDIDPNLNIHRTFFGRDLYYMCRGLRLIYGPGNIVDGTFESLFEENVWKGIELTRKLFCNANEGIYNKHLPNPVREHGHAASACKGMHLMLRWLVRNDGIVDMGIWKHIPPSKLYIPLDIHVGSIGRSLGLITIAKGCDRKAVEEITERLWIMNPPDPCIYDFALYGYGELLKKCAK